MRSFRIYIFFLVLAAFVAESLPRVFALDPKFYGVDVACEAQVSPPSLVLTWPQVNYARQYTIRRRMDQTAGWGEPVAVLPGTSSGYTDTNLSIGIAYEYEIDMQTVNIGYEGTFIDAYSYLDAGINVSVRESMGSVLVLVDSSVISGIASALTVFEQDLLGAGWSVVERQVDRNAEPVDVKNVVRAEYNADPASLRSIVLIGHVPVPYSGNIAPDMHETHQGAWPADVYYADLNGTWTDKTVSVLSQDSPANDNLPGDGKFDQSDIPAAINLEIGRIDFADLPSFAPRTEVDLLNTYLRKDHEFRHRLFTAPGRALVHDNFGDIAGDAPAVDAWRHFSGFFGHGSVQEIGPDGFMPTLNSQSYLWAYGCGGGSFMQADGVGTTQDFAAGDPQAVFYILHGSYFGDWNSEDNFLRAAIATPHMSLASIWSGLPHWYMHHLALGETLGFSTRVTQNNRGTYKSYRNFSAGQVHIALMGDPTLQIYPVAPPNGLMASVNNAVQLNWGASPDESIAGYKVYHALNANGPYRPLVSLPIADRTFTHLAGAGTNYYMVRAVKLERTGSGSYYNLSQGIFVTAVTGGVGNRPPSADSSSVTTPEDVPVSVQLAGSDPEGAPLQFRIVSGPSHGSLSGTAPGLTYTPDAKFTGNDSFEYVVNDGAQDSPLATVEIAIQPPPPRLLTAIVVQGSTVTLRVAGPASTRFQVLSSSDAESWAVAAEGTCDSTGAAEIAVSENGARLKLYRVYWP